jgi:hypothetical protein
VKSEPRLAIQVNCLLTLFRVIFANGLSHRFAWRDFACCNAVISVVPAAKEAVPGTSVVDVKKFTVLNSALHISAP